MFLVSYFFGVHIDLQYFFEVSVPFDLFSAFLVILIFLGDIIPGFFSQAEEK